MANRLSIFILFTLLFLLASVQLVLAITTGKIAGQVVDKDTGEPLIGVNIIVQDTPLGASSDNQGFYTILLIPPGLYRLQASYIGYTKMFIEDVRVQIGQTARVDFKLAVETITGEEVTIVAEKDIIRQDVATSVVAFSTDEVAVLPLVNVHEVVGLQAGVEDGLIIRGGGADQALFQVDGITLRDPRNNQPLTGIALSAVKEVSIERGGFNAEYGQVRSGIVNIVAKEGGIKGYSGSITLKYSPPAKKYFGLSPYDPNSMWMRPYLDPEVAWVGTETGWADDPYLQRQYPQFDGWNKISEQSFTDDDPKNDLTPEGAQRLFKWQHRRRPKTNQPDYNIDAGFGGPVPLVGKMLGNLRFFSSFRTNREMLVIPLSRDDYLDYDGTLQLTSEINKSMKLKFTGLTGKSYNVAMNATDDRFYNNKFGINGEPYWSATDYLRTPLQIASVNATNEPRAGRIFCDSWYSTAEVKRNSYATKLTHVLSPKTFYEASIEYIICKYQTQPIRNRNLDTLYQVVEGYPRQDETPFGFYTGTELTGIDGMMTGGHTSTSRDSSVISATTLKWDLTSQVNYANQVKSGIEFAYNDLDLKYGRRNYAYKEKILVRMHKFPIRGAFYVQDKLETKGFILNLGLRLDYSNANTSWQDVNPFEKSYFSQKYDPSRTYSSKESKAQFNLSPRLGISHPITATSKLFFNYGHFMQLPTYEQIFRMSRDLTGKMTNIGDPDLVMAKTVSYELGYDHSIKDFLIQLAAFYHDISDQQSFTSYRSADQSCFYDLASNQSYADIRGFELTLRKRTGKWWNGFANYTYQVNTAGHFGSAIVYQDPSEQRKYNYQTKNLYQERPIPQPIARASLNFFTPQDFGPKVGAFHPLQQWALNLIATWRAGEWVDWSPLGPETIDMNVQVKDYYNFVLRLDKTFEINKMKLSFFVDIENLFNTKRLSGAGFYDPQDQIEYFESLHLPPSSYYTNIPGHDRIGDYRDDGVAFQPIEQAAHVTELDNPSPKVIYYDKSSKRYMQFVDNEWSEVNKGKMDKILKDKAYINMPNQTWFNFLNPRQIFFGIRTSFDLN